MAKKENIKFNIGGRDLAFYTLYSALRMYKDHKSHEEKSLEKGAFLFVAAEAYVFLEDLKEQFPKEYEEAEKEYNEFYGQERICNLCFKRVDPKKDDNQIPF